MNLLRNTITGLLSLTIVTHASNVMVRNYCPDLHWITEINGTWNSNGTWGLDSGIAYVNEIVGKGNSLGVTKTNTYWDEGTPKLILGYSIDNGELWWSVSSYDGEPYDPKHFNVTSPRSPDEAVPEDLCGNARGYEAKNHNCPDNNVTLILNLCAEY